MLNLKNMLLSTLVVAGLSISLASVAEPLSLETLWQTSNTNMPTVLDAQLQERKRPAVDACEGKDAGASCSFTGKKGRTVNGQCETRQNKSVCVSERHRKRREACDDKQVGDSCSFTGKRNNTVNGQCVQRRNNEVVCKKAK